MSSQLIQNPLIPSSFDGTVTAAKRIDSFQLDLRSFGSSAARLSLTNLSGDANLRVLKGTTELKTSTNGGKLSESILLGDATTPLAPDLYTIEVTLANDATSATYKLNVAVNADADLSNIWWRNPSGGEAAVWQMNGTTIAGSETYGSLAAEWQVQGVEDLDADGEDDLLWRNTRTGDIAYWLFKAGKRVAAGASFASAIPLDWKIAAVKDLDGDSQADLVWHNPTAGMVALWTLKGGVYANGNAISIPGWQPVASAYFDSDAKSDIIFRNESTGQIAFWKMDGTSPVAGNVIPTGPSWQPQFYGYFNNDARQDVMLRDSVSGSIAFWQMDGVNVRNPWASTPISLEWQVEAIGNFDGSVNGGTDDLLWRNRRTGELGIWTFNQAGTDFAARGPITRNGTAYNKGADWTIAGVGDFNSDGKKDILYRNRSQGLVEVLLMNGLTITEVKSYSGVDSNWSVGGIMEREVLAEPFEISGRTPTNSFTDALAFNIGTIEGRGTYVDTVRSGFDDYYKFSTSVRSNIRLELLNSPTVQFQLLPILANGNLGSALTYSRDMVLEIGSYAVKVATTTGTATPYTLSVFGQPESTDLATVSFTTTAGNQLTLKPSADRQSNVITTSFKVKNNGSSAINNVEVGIRISRDQTISTSLNSLDAALRFANPTGADNTILTITTPIDPGEERSFNNVQVLLPDTVDPFWFVDGKYTLGLVVDPANRLTEVNETNNLNGDFGKDRIELTILGTETTEVIGSQMTLVSGTFTPGGTVKLRVSVENIGNKAVPNGISIPILFYLSPDGVINNEDLALDLTSGAAGYFVRNVEAGTGRVISPLGGARDDDDGLQAGEVSPIATFEVDLVLPPASGTGAWGGWTQGSTFYISSWIDPFSDTLAEVDLVNNKLDATLIGTPNDTVGKNYLKFTR